MILANAGIGGCCREVKGQNRDTGVPEKCEIAIGQISALGRKRFYQDLRHRKGARVEPVSSDQHSAAELRDSIGKGRATFEKVNEQISVPEDFGQIASYQSLSRMRRSINKPYK